MGFFQNCFDILIHLDVHLGALIRYCGLWTYLVLFAIIFAETGLVVAPFLPGDSLLFVLGAFAARGSFNPVILAVILAVAAVLGDNVNYLIGKYLGSRLVHSKRFPLIKKEHLDRTHHFYKKYGAKAIILARFIPIIRMFAPFVAGIVRMDYPKFFTYNVTGGILWITIFISGGYFFGNIPAVKENFSLAVLLIIVISLLPAVVGFLKMSPRANGGLKSAASEEGL